MRRTVMLCLLLFPVGGLARAAGAGTPAGTGTIDFHGYTRCVKLENADCRVVLCHQSGGRVLEYSWKGTSVIPLDPKAAGKVYDPVNKRGGAADGGRLDIGPEQVIPKHPMLWVGPWTAEITGPRAARLTSVRDEPTGVQLVREFALAARGSHLRVTQIIKNVSTETKHWCHWSRTFAPGGGIVVIPLSKTSRFPHHYIMYGPGPVMNYRPKDPNILVGDKFLLITGTPAQAKLGFDSAVGWLAYVMKNDHMWVKKFAVYPGRPYNEMAGLTLSIWYYKDELCELEPIGPRTNIKPGGSASFTEDWWILPWKYAGDPAKIDAEGIEKAVKALRSLPARPDPDLN